MNGTSYRLARSLSSRSTGSRLLAAGVILGAVLVSASVSSGHANRSVAQATSFRLVDTWDVPDTSITWPVAPTGVEIWEAARGVVVVDTNPARLLVLAPDGGTQRVIGLGALVSPLDVAVLTTQDPTDLAAARLFVTEPALGRVQLFSGHGALLATVEGLGRPSHVASAGNRVYVTETDGRRILLFDAAGQQVGVWQAGSPPLDQLDTPSCIDAIEDPAVGELAIVAVCDDADGQVLWLDSTGETLGVSTLPIAGESAMLDLALASERSEHGFLPVYIATEEGLFMDYGWGQLAPVQIADAGAVTGIRAIAAIRVKGQLFLYPDDSVLLYMVDRGRSALSRFYHVRSSTRLSHACPWVDAEGSYPWRIASDGTQSIYVAHANGVVSRFSAAGQLTKYAEVGDIDDFAVDVSGRVHVNARNMHLIQRPDGVVEGFSDWAPYDRLAWTQEYVCTPAGYGVQGSIDMLPSGEAGSLVAVSTILEQMSFSAASIQRHLVLTPDGWHGGVRWWPWLQKEAPSLDEARVMTDVATDESGTGAHVVDRLRGQVVPVIDMASSVGQLGTPQSVPGTPNRIARGPGNSRFVLTAEGYVYQLSSTGVVVVGWDAAGAPNGPRAELVDIAVLGDRLYLLDGANSRVLIFEPGDSEPEVPSLPPRCTARADKNAEPDSVFVGSPLSVTLRLDGSCGRVSAESDILLLLDPFRSPQTEANYNVALPAFVDAVDMSRDRVAVMRYDATGALVQPFTTDTSAVKQAIPAVWGARVPWQEPHPLDIAREYMLAAARSDANRIVVLVIGGATHSWNDAVAAQRMRLADIRVLSIGDSIRSGFVPVAVASRLEDAFLAPDAASLEQAYAQIGRDLSARVLARDLTVVDVVPENMTYENGSSSPAANWDQASRTLTWRANSVSFRGWQATYRLAPQQAGRWPTNTRAEASIVDGFGHAFTAAFPVPWVQVSPPPTPSPTSTHTPTTVPSTTATSPTSATPSATPYAVYLPITFRHHCVPQYARSDIALVFDTSSSMAGNQISDAQSAALTFVDLIDLTPGRGQVAVVRFDQEAEVVQPLTRSRHAIESGIRGLRLRSGTRIDLGLRVALGELQSERHAERNAPALLLLTDGQHAGVRGEDLKAASEVREAGVRVYTIGLGADVDAATLTAIAGDDERYFFAPDSTDLTRIYREIAADLMCPGNSGAR